MLFFLLVCRAKMTYCGFSSWVVILIAYECFVVLSNRGYSYKSYERKLILRYHPLSKARSMNSLLTSFNITWDIRPVSWTIQVSALSLDLLQCNCRCVLVSKINSWRAILHICNLRKNPTTCPMVHKIKISITCYSLFTVWSNIECGNLAFSI